MSSILSSLTKLASGSVTQDLIISQPAGKTAALRAMAMNYNHCAIIPALLPDPLDLNVWTVTFTIVEPEVVKGEPQTISLILPNFNQPNLLVEIVSIVLQPFPSSPAFGKIPPYIDIAPQINGTYWFDSTVTALTSSSPLYSIYKFTPADYDARSGLANSRKMAVVTVAFKGTTAN